MTAQPGSPIDAALIRRQQQLRRRQEAHRLRQDLVWAVGLSLLMHGGLLWWALAERLTLDPPSPDLIEFRLISPPEDPEIDPLDPAELTSVADAQAAGESKPEEPDLSAGGSQISPLSPPQPERDRSSQNPAVDSSVSDPRVVGSAPVATLQRYPQPQPVDRSNPVSDLHHQLEQAVQDRQWQRAAAVAEQMALVLPQRSGELMAYQDQLYQLASQDQNTPEPPTPTAQPSPQIPTATPTQPPSPRPSPSPRAIADPEQVDLTPVIATAPAPTQGTEPQETADQSPSVSEPSIGSGSGGQVSGVANSQRAAEAPTQLATIADPAWSDYLARLQAKVQQQWSVRQAQDSYSTVVMFTLSQHGQLQDIELRSPSQDPLVDAAVMSAIRQAAPFDPLPASFTGEQFTFQLEVLSGSQGIGHYQ